MAYSLSSSPSSSLSRETHLFCNSLSPPDLFQLRIHKNLNFPLKIHPVKSSLRVSSRVSLQELHANAVSQDSEIPDEKGVASPKSHVWVNPKSPRASKLRQKSYDFSVVEQDAVIILNNMSNPETALVVLNYFQKRLRVSRETVLYNVTLKVFRKCKDLDGAESLFSCMLEKGVKPDNVTFSTIISCARQCSLPEKAVEWFEKMPSFWCEPDEVTCSVMVDAYGRVGNVDLRFEFV
ncbi:UNVERIFIED_CONTAM: Pentatricopeptide repeat-containing protein, chloroplastic [Sesamum radiatum]|uniref:Pentatricopeptide repeat-containing protein, chloroplastic n=1 Tax=Sesamum radiatum TaxID=300843 RepID=A0AAW2LRA4_SESRA